MMMKKLGCSEFIIEMYDECWNEFELVPNAILSTRKRQTMKQTIPRHI